MSVKKQEQDILEREQRYTVGKIDFIVKPKFKSDCKETLGSVLLKLMQNEVDSSQ